MQLALWVTATTWYCLWTLTLGDISPDGSNLIVYLYQSSGSGASPEKICTGDAIDAGILGFVRSFTGTHGYPTIDFGPYICSEVTSKNTIAPGCPECNALAQEIKKCQEKGKEVFVSIGGASSHTSVQIGEKGREEAIKAATWMWDLLGQGENSKSLRPLGKELVVDEFDVVTILCLRRF